MVAAHSALLALLTEQTPECEPDGITVTLTTDDEMGMSLDVVYTRKGLPIAGEGL
ncbi:hypothetical protein [Acidovorax sp.]|uniref:hypothetical protein n=1 Tax=Acidovorax sp. TaxID=1872122 RepID=UPI0039E4ADF6